MFKNIIIAFVLLISLPLYGADLAQNSVAELINMMNTSDDAELLFDIGLVLHKKGNSGIAKEAFMKASGMGHGNSTHALAILEPSTQAKIAYLKLAAEQGSANGQRDYADYLYRNTHDTDGTIKWSLA